MREKIRGGGEEDFRRGGKIRRGGEDEGEENCFGVCVMCVLCKVVKESVKADALSSLSSSSYSISFTLLLSPSPPSLFFSLLPSLVAKHANV